MRQDPKRNEKLQRKQTAMLLTVAAGMFGFAFALVPLYNVFCELTGLNGKTSSQPAGERVEAVSDREVTIQFLGQPARGLAWEFRPTETSLRVRLGETATTQYYARNRLDWAVTGQAVPSVAPGYAAQHLRKIECFCFTQQMLEGGAEIEMPVLFYVSTDLPEDVATLTLSYTMFRVSDDQALQPDRASTMHEQAAEAHDHLAEAHDHVSEADVL